jgi:hypothetical protein
VPPGRPWRKLPLQGQQIATDGGDQLMSSPDHDASPTLSIVDLAEI